MGLTRPWAGRLVRDRVPSTPRACIVLYWRCTRWSATIIAYASRPKLAVSEKHRKNLMEITWMMEVGEELAVAVPHRLGADSDFRAALCKFNLPSGSTAATVWVHMLLQPAVAKLTNCCLLLYDIECWTSSYPGAWLCDRNSLSSKTHQRNWRLAYSNDRCIL